MLKTMPAEILPVFFSQKSFGRKKLSIIKIEKIFRKGDFVNGKIIGGRIGRTKRKRIQ